MVHIASNKMWQIESKVCRNIKKAVCIIVYLPVFSVIMDTVIITQLNRRFSHVPNLIRENCLTGRLNQLNLTVSN